MTAQQYSKGGHLYLAIAIVLSGFLSLYNSVAMNVAIPSFMSVFDCDLKTVQWFMISYTLALGVLSPTAGYFSDRFSCRNLFTVSMVCLAVAAILAGFSQSAWQMILFRVIQGAAATCIVPCAMTIIYQYIPRRRQETFLTLQAMSLSLGPAFGPVVAGYLLTAVGWQWLFWLNVPIALLSAAAIYRAVPYETKPLKGRLDYQGFFYVITGCVLFLLSFNKAEDWGLLSPQVLLMLAVGGGLIAMFVRREMRHPEPILNFSVLKHRDYSICLIINVILSMTLCLGPFLLAIYLQSVLDMTPFQAGLFLLPPAIFSIGGAPVAQILYRKMPHWLLVCGGLVLMVLSNYFLGKLFLGISLAWVMFWICFRYLSIGLLGMPINDMGMRVIPVGISSHGAAFLNWCKLMATSLALSLFTMVLNMRTAYYSQGLAEAEAQLMGINDVFICSAVMAAVGMVLSLWLRQPKTTTKQ